MKIAIALSMVVSIAAANAGELPPVPKRAEDVASMMMAFIVIYQKDCIKATPNAPIFSAKGVRNIRFMRTMISNAMLVQQLMNMGDEKPSCAALRPIVGDFFLNGVQMSK